MTIEEIELQRSILEEQLHRALASMELNDAITKIRYDLKILQAKCPHQDDKYNYELKTFCPICGKKFKEGK